MKRETDGNWCGKTEYWEQQVILWEGSGTTQKEFCNKHEINVSVFGYWKRKLRTQQADVVEFLPVAVSPPTISPATTSGIRLVPSHGRFHIELATNFVPSTLRSLLNSLDGI